MSGTPITQLLREEGSAAAGVCHARGMNLGLPPVWMIYLPVGNIRGEPPSCGAGRRQGHQGDERERVGSPCTRRFGIQVGACLALGTGVKTDRLDAGSLRRRSGPNQEKRGRHLRERRRLRWSASC